MFATCKESEATHVRVLEDEHGHFEMSNLTVGKIYKILENDEYGYESEEMIEADNGDLLCSFSLYVEVEWLKAI